MRRRLKVSEVNHLRRLLAWVRCEIPPDPSVIVETVQRIAPCIETASEEGKQRLVDWHRESTSVPLYIRAALKALNKMLEDYPIDAVDGQSSRIKALPQSTGEG